MKNILVPTDFSENAMNAIEYAVKLFKQEECTIYFMHAYADEVYNFDSGLSRTQFNIFKEKLGALTDKSLQDVLDHVKKKSPFPNHEYHIKSVFRPLVDAVNEFVVEKNIDIVIMGTKGQSNDKEITFGSHTLQVLKYAQCPVLAIPKNCAFSSPRNMLFPTDYQVPYSKKELELLNDLAGSYKSTIHVLHMSRAEKLSIRQEDNKLFLKRYLSKTKLVFTQLPSEFMIGTINRHLKESEMHLLVMVNSRQSALEKILFQSTVDKIGLKTKIPFLVLQNMRG